MDFDSDIICVGGGLNGCTLALAMADGGLSVTLIDALPRDTRDAADFDGRGYALAAASQRMLGALGVWDVVAPHAQPMLDIKVTDGKPGTGAAPFFLHFDHSEIGQGPMGFMVEDRFLRRALLAAVDAHPQITVLSGQRVIDQTTDSSGAQVTLDDGNTLRGRVLIGSDGKNSATATRAGIKRDNHDYGQIALVAAVAHELPHNATAHQYFMPAGPLAILPLPGNQSSIVWSEEAQNARRISSLDDDGFLDELRPRFGSFLGDLSLVGGRFSYPLVRSLAQSFTASRIALIGDAAHAVHPIAGQGLNLGLRDVAALAEVVISAKRRGEDIGAADVLERYGRWRRWDTELLARTTHGINALFSNDNSVLRGLRDMGLGAVNALPGLRKTLMREAAGLSGDMPKLLQGRQI